MVCHVGLHDGMVLTGWHARFGEIERLIKAVTPKHVQLLQACQVFQHCPRLQRKPQERRIGSYDQLTGKIAFVAQVGHSKSPVLVIQVYIEGISNLILKYPRVLAYPARNKSALRALRNSCPRGTYRHSFW